ncbi:MAG: hypothetical protein CL868_05730 [Cytophagaceae bacterium]|nr:hypothetical protein [Cytophagaceae bacterium]|tara:strand:+ start:2344 stop:3489 length:1146 start_codon:yes stop_codon:yes gene_type:complete
MKYTIYADDRIVMSLDAGGTNFVFSAIKGGKQLIEPIALPSYSQDKEKCLKTMINGFKKVIREIAPQKPAAISFAFPGPADYKNGIIGDLPNFPSFKGGVAIGPMLEGIFNIPTLINNDGDLFAYGEAVQGFLPYINKTLEEHGISKRYSNLLGITLGTGFGAGVVINGQICLGDNSGAGEIWLSRNFHNTKTFAEEGVSIRAVQRVYCELTRCEDLLSPKRIYEIAKGKRKGNQEAAIKAFETMGAVIGEALANSITIIDAPVVIGGGIAGAYEFIVPAIVKHLNSTIEDYSGNTYSRLVSTATYIDDAESYKSFVHDDSRTVDVPFSDEKVVYNMNKKIPIGLSRLGTSEAVWLGAYALALDYLDKKNLYEPSLLNADM